MMMARSHLRGVGSARWGRAQSASIDLGGEARGLRGEACNLESSDMERRWRSLWECCFSSPRVAVTHRRVCLPRNLSFQFYPSTLRSAARRARAPLPRASRRRSGTHHDRLPGTLTLRPPPQASSPGERRGEMGHRKSPGDGFYSDRVPEDGPLPPDDAAPGPCPDSSYRIETDIKDNVTARKIQKADREKMRRDRLNEQFQELSNALDPDRPKNDKATILADAVQMLEDLTTQVNRLKAEYASLLDESRELTQEKNELKEEKATLKADVENLNSQYHHRVRNLLPWSSINPSMMMHPPPYPYALPLHVPSGPVAMHPSLQPYPFFPNHSAGSAATPCPGFVPFLSPCNPRVELPPNLHASAHQQTSNGLSQTSCLHDPVGRFSDHQRTPESAAKDDFCNVATELELKTPGSAPSSHSESTHNQDACSRTIKEHLFSAPSTKNGLAEANSSNRCSSSYGLQDTSSDSIGDGSIDEN